MTIEGYIRPLREKDGHTIVIVAKGRPLTEKADGVVGDVIDIKALNQHSQTRGVVGGIARNGDQLAGQIMEHGQSYAGIVEIVTDHNLQVRAWKQNPKG